MLSDTAFLRRVSRKIRTGSRWTRGDRMDATERLDEISNHLEELA